MDIIVELIRFALLLAPSSVVKAILQQEEAALTPEQIAKADAAYELALRVKFGDDPNA